MYSASTSKSNVASRAPIGNSMKSRNAVNPNIGLLPPRPQQRQPPLSSSNGFRLPVLRPLADQSSSTPSRQSMANSTLEGLPVNSGAVSGEITAWETRKRIRFLTGNIEKIVKWHGLVKEFCHFEVIAPIIGVQNGTLPKQEIILLRDRCGPVMKIIHYTIDRINLTDFYIGQVIRCVGRMVAPATLHAVNIREATQDEITSLPRMTSICELEVKSMALNKS